MRIGLIGAGAIANFILNELNTKQHSDYQIKSILVRNREKYQALETEYGVTLVDDLDSFLDDRIDIVVEAADIKAVKTLLPSIIKKKDTVVISIGAFADEEFLKEISAIVHQYPHAIHLPSGAVGGLDLIQNANALSTIDSVSLTTRKPAHSLLDQPVDEELVVFEGVAMDAIKQFPKNINVSIILSLAGVGIDKTRVKIIADPHIDKNMHHVEIRGDFGEAEFSITNNPLPENPKTSYLAAMSVLGTIKRLRTQIGIGK